MIFGKMLTDGPTMYSAGDTRDPGRQMNLLSPTDEHRTVSYSSFLFFLRPTPPSACFLTIPLVEAQVF